MTNIGQPIQQSGTLPAAIWMIVSLVLLSAFYLFTLNSESYEPGLFGAKSLGLNVGICILFALFFCALGKQMTTLWLSLNTVKPLARLYDLIVIPIMAIIFPLGAFSIEYKFPTELSISQIVVCGFTLIWLADPLSLIRQCLVSPKLLFSPGNSILLGEIPPKSFADITPMFLVMHAVFLFSAWRL